MYQSLLLFMAELNSIPLWGCVPFVSSHLSMDIWVFPLKSRSKVTQSLSRVLLFATPRTVAYQVPLSMGFSRQEYWSGLPFRSPGDLTNPGIEPGSPSLQTDALPSESLLWTLVYKFLFEHPYGLLTEEPPMYFPQKFHHLYLFSFFVSPIETNILIHSSCPCLKIPVSLSVSFMSAHPEILGDIAMNSLCGAPAPPLPMERLILRNPSPQPHSKDSCQHLLPLPAMGTCTWRERTSPSLGCSGRWACLPLGRMSWMWGASVEFHHWCPCSSRSRSHPRASAEVPWGDGDLRAWWPAEEDVFALGRDEVLILLSSCLLGDRTGALEMAQVRVLTIFRNKDLGTNRLFGRSQETPTGNVTIEDAWGSVLAWTLWETVSSHWQVKKLGCSSLKSYPHRLTHGVSCLPM